MREMKEKDRIDYERHRRLAGSTMTYGIGLILGSLGTAIAVSTGLPEWRVILPGIMLVSLVVTLLVGQKAEGSAKTLEDIFRSPEDVYRDKGGEL